MASVSDFAEIVPERTLRYWLKRGYIDGYRYVWGWKVNPQDVLDYLTEITLYRAVRRRKPVYVLAMKMINGYPIEWQIYEEWPKSMSLADLARTLDQKIDEPVRYIGVFPTQKAALAAGERLWEKYKESDNTGWLFWLW